MAPWHEQRNFLLLVPRDGATEVRADRGENTKLALLVFRYVNGLLGYCFAPAIHLLDLNGAHDRLDQRGKVAVCTGQKQGSVLRKLKVAILGGGLRRASVRERGVEYHGKRKCFEQAATGRIVAWKRRSAGHRYVRRNSAVDWVLRAGMRRKFFVALSFVEIFYFS